MKSRKLSAKFFLLVAILISMAGGLCGYGEYSARREALRVEKLRKQRIELAKEIGKEFIRNEFSVLAEIYDLVTGCSDKK